MISWYFRVTKSVPTGVTSVHTRRVPTDVKTSALQVAHAVKTKTTMAMTSCMGARLIAGVADLSQKQNATRICTTTLAVVISKEPGHTLATVWAAGNTLGWGVARTNSKAPAKRLCGRMTMLVVALLYITCLAQSEFALVLTVKITTTMATRIAPISTMTAQTTSRQSESRPRKSSATTICTRVASSSTGTGLSFAMAITKSR